MTISDAPIPVPDTKAAALPDFIIVGAMKSGTSSLHHILNCHPGVFVPEQEIHFFDIDDLEQHPDFVLCDGQRWWVPDFEANFDDYFRWYQQHFSGAAAGQCIGEDSTTYLASALAPGRIAATLPNAKIIIMLRDPVHRAYSQYWHWVRSGRALGTFEQMLRETPLVLLQRSFYKEQVDRVLAAFDRPQVHFVIFEQFVREMQEVVDRTCRFLGLSGSIPLEECGSSWKNRALVPRSLRLQLWHNWLFRGRLGWRYSRHLPYGPDGTSIQHGPTDWLSGLFHRINLHPARPPAMAVSTRDALQTILRERNRGLAELLGLALKPYWPYFEE